MTSPQVIGADALLPSVPLPLQTFTVSDTKGDSFGNKVKGRTIPGYGVVVVARAALEPHYEGYVSLPYVKPIIISSLV